MIWKVVDMTNSNIKSRIKYIDMNKAAGLISKQKKHKY